MRKIINYLQQQEKLTIYFVILLGIVFVTFVELNKGDAVTIVHAQTNEGEVESIVVETIDLDEQEQELSKDAEEEILMPIASNSLVDEDSIDITIETESNSASGGISIDIQPVEEKEEEEVVELVEVILDANGVPNEEEGCLSDKFTYMAYTKVTTEASDQYQFLYNDDLCYTDPETGIRMSEGRYCIAVGSFYTTQIGQKIDLVLSNGEIIKCVLGDCKSDEHTDETNRYHAEDGSVAEFIVDYDVFEDTSQWSNLNLTTIEEIRLVTEEEA